ncbi:MFS transporter [Marinimicrobium alkaliphilum]|uniref:MFS transporter n=1 Tax=Marinimicrobium alkaliphilum TaxID=2202654 RepID=UPI000DBA5592|nr:MFS transporter [Marinimicrobium alkaliphilum]
MNTAKLDANGIHRSRLFAGVCLALFPTAFSFALVGGILGQLKTEFILTNADVGFIGGAVLWGMALSLIAVAPVLEKIGLRVAAAGAFVGHLVGVSLLLLAYFSAGSPSGFWILFLGAICLGIGNGLIEAAGNPMTAALYPERKTVKLNHFHAFFPGGMVVGALLGWLMFQIGSIGALNLGHWTVHIAVMYIPIIVYGAMILPLKFPKTETAEAGVPVGEILRYTLTHPIVLLLILIKMITLSLELGPMRWIPDVLENAGMHGLLVFAWITGLMAVLRLFAGPVVERLAPTGMLFCSAVLTGLGLIMFASFETGIVKLLFAATVFAFGVAFFFPTMVGLMSERFPKAGSVGIVLMIGAGMAASGTLQGQMGVIADRYMPDALDEQRTVRVMEQVQERFPAYVDQARAAGDDLDELARLGFLPEDLENVIGHNERALSYYRSNNELDGQLTGNALRSLLDSGLAEEGELIEEAGAVLRPADNYGGRMAFRWVAPVALIVAAFFAIMFLQDRKRGGYRAVKLDENTGAQ